MPLTRGEACLESKAERIARIITARYGLTVRVQGPHAYIDMKNNVIVLPALSDKEYSELGDILDGTLDHECAHGLFSEGGDFLDKLEPQVKNVTNAIEDIRVERMMGKKYIGCKQNLTTLSEIYRGHLAKKSPDLSLFNYLIMAFQFCLEGTRTIADYSSDPRIGKLLASLAEEVAIGKKLVDSNTGTSYDSLELARRVLDKIKSIAEQKPKQDSKAGKGQGKGEKKEKKEKGKGKDKKAEKETDKGDPDSDGDDDSEGENDNEEGEGKGEEGEENGGEGEGDMTPDDMEDGEGESEENPNTGEAQEQANAVKESMEDNDASLDSREDLFNSKIKPKEKGYNDPENYIVYSNQYDKDTTYSADDRLRFASEYNRLKKEVYDYIGTMAANLELALAQESESRWIGGSRRGRKWDKRKMPQYFLGGDDDRVWRQIEQGEDYDTAVSLLWDCSGSMGTNSYPNNKAAIARLAAIAFHEALVKCNIAHEVLGFNTGGGYSSELKAEIDKLRKDGADLQRYSRLYELDSLKVFVPFGSADGRAIVALDGGYANRDGEAVRWAALRLAARPEKRKILIVGSDGQPSGAAHSYTERKYLQEIVKQVCGSGIEVIAIGIQDDSVKHYYPVWTVIENAKDLPKIVIGEVGKALLARGYNGHYNFPKAISH